MGWIISPSNDVLNYGDGSFLLPCRESNVDYSITYITDDGCSSNTVSYTYVTSGSCSSPVITCPDYNYLISFNSTVNSGGGTCIGLARFKNNITNFSTAITVSLSDGQSIPICSTATTWDTDSTWNVLQVNVPQNTSTNSRTITINSTLTHTGGTTCSSAVTITQYGTEPPPTPSGFRLKIQVHNSTNETIYWDEISLNFSDGHYEDPEHCFSCQDNTTVTWLTGNGNEYFTFSHYSSTDTPTLTSAVLHITDSSCNNSSSARLTTTQTTLHDGDTLLLQYNGNEQIRLTINNNSSAGGTINGYVITYNEGGQDTTTFPGTMQYDNFDADLTIGKTISFDRTVILIGTKPYFCELGTGSDTVVRYGGHIILNVTTAAPI